MHMYVCAREMERERARETLLISMGLDVNRDLFLFLPNTWSKGLYLQQTTRVNKGLES